MKHSPSRIIAGSGMTTNSSNNDKDNAIMTFILASGQRIISFYITNPRWEAYPLPTLPNRYPFCHPSSCVCFFATPPPHCAGMAMIVTGRLHKHPTSPEPARKGFGPGSLQLPTCAARTSHGYGSGV